MNYNIQPACMDRGLYVPGSSLDGSHGLPYFTLTSDCEECALIILLQKSETQTDQTSLALIHNVELNLRAEECRDYYKQTEKGYTA